MNSLIMAIGTNLILVAFVIVLVGVFALIKMFYSEDKERIGVMEPGYTLEHQNKKRNICYGVGALSFILVFYTIISIGFDFSLMTPLMSFLAVAYIALVPTLAFLLSFALAKDITGYNDAFIGAIQLVTSGSEVENIYDELCFSDIVKNVSTRHEAEYGDCKI